MVSAQFEALLLAPILAPVFGGDAAPLGGLGVQLVSEKLAASAFGHLVAERLGRSRA